MTAPGSVSTRTGWRFAAGVSVLTCGAADRAHGVTVSTLSVASVHPPMVSVALRRGSRGLGALLTAGRFVVNGLSVQQAPLARYFARKDRSDGLALFGPEAESAWESYTADGVPLLAGTVGRLECRIERTVPVGDHELLIARVLGSYLGSGTPLLNIDTRS
jgi:flavin reductase (DIM6/NTAB) family NADH-FMN oxidoreductase RutF